MRVYYTTEEGGELLPFRFTDFLDKSHQPDIKALIMVRRVGGVEERVAFDLVLRERKLPPWRRHEGETP